MAGNPNGIDDDEEVTLSRKRVPWDGPNPRPGDYLETKLPATVWLLRSVEPLRRPDVSGARLVLDVVAVPRHTLPLGASVHPWLKMAPHDPAGPARVRQVYDGPAALMRANWRDPEDMRTQARRAREIGGWRSYCPLRRMASYRNSQITERHIIAADHLRMLADSAIHGFSAREGMMPIGAVAYGPRPGPSAAAVAQAFAAHDLSRVLRRFTAPQQWMLVHVVLLNRTLTAWCGGREGLNPQVEMGRLVCSMDQLEEYYSSEIDRVMAAEQMVRAA